MITPDRSGTGSSSSHTGLSLCVCVFQQDSSVLLEDDGGSEDSGSESPARPVVRSAVWEDEDDELDEE